MQSTLIYYHILKAPRTKVYLTTLNWNLLGIVRLHSILHLVVYRQSKWKMIYFVIQPWTWSKIFLSMLISNDLYLSKNCVAIITVYFVSYLCHEHLLGITIIYCVSAIDGGLRNIINLLRIQPSCSLWFLFNLLSQWHPPVVYKLCQCLQSFLSTKPLL